MKKSILALLALVFLLAACSGPAHSQSAAPAEEPAALIALEKETGKVAWAFGLSSRSESSPIALYDEQGNGWIVQCARNGTILLLDGLTGEEAASLSVDGEITASPAVYGGIMVVCTTGGTVFGILIGQ